MHSVLSKVTASGSHLSTVHDQPPQTEGVTHYSTPPQSIFLHDKDKLMYFLILIGAGTGDVH